MTTTKQPLLVIVTGSRQWRDAAPIRDDLFAVRATGRLWGVMEGGATGVDAIACGWASQHSTELAHYHMPADWQRYGLKAGPIRNQEMVDKAKELCSDIGVMPIVFAYPILGSRGTRNMMELARRAQLRVVDRSVR